MGHPDSNCTHQLQGKETWVKSSMICSGRLESFRRRKVTEIRRDCYCLDTTYWPNALNVNTAESFVCKSWGCGRTEAALPSCHRTGWMSATRKKIADSNRGRGWDSKSAELSVGFCKSPRAARFSAWLIGGQKMNSAEKLLHYLFWPLNIPGKNISKMKLKSKEALTLKFRFLCTLPLLQWGVEEGRRLPIWCLLLSCHESCFSGS